MRPLYAVLAVLWLGLSACGTRAEAPDTTSVDQQPFVLVLGVGQDGGVPQTGDWDHPGWDDPEQTRRVSSLGFVDPVSGTSLLFDATPDIASQLRDLHHAGASTLPDIFLTHAHMGHYTGLMFLGHESLGASGVPVHAMPRMAQYLRENGPWSQLVTYENIQLQPLKADSSITRGVFTVTPLLVPHRQEFSEVVGYRIHGPERAVLFIPDIDSWREWDEQGVRLEDQLSQVDLAYLDATFFANGEIPGRDMSGFPHPFITTTMERLADLPAKERGKVRFIHLNHTNPVLWDSPERAEVLAAGFGIAEEGQKERL